jgi:hypothetical protein
MRSSTSTTVVCTFCNAPAPGLYVLPARVARRLPLVRPACYFCFIRISGIRPTRSRLVSAIVPAGDTDPR